MDNISGFLLIDKPPGPTSHDIVDRLRRITGIRKIGHAGTLDPFASGLLLVAIGRGATREISTFVGLSKEYEAEILLGAKSTTLDIEGDIELVPFDKDIDKQSIENAIKSLTGHIEQIPPMYAAIKINGKKLYELAREGKEIERKPRPVHIETFRLLSEPEKLTDGTIKLRAEVSCSSGTYVRSLALDLGEKLGTSGYLTALRRTKIGQFDVNNAVKTEDLDNNWQEKLLQLSD
ncbi:MAG: tRNA pseudouridine(55) synthase TruB [bacterium]|nr:tRNA pseudouridine(55) synthase TruB [bacterium]